MEILKTFILLLIGSAMICFIYRSFDASTKEDLYEEYRNSLIDLLKSSEFSATHVLLHFNILAHCIKDEIIKHGNINDNPYTKGLIKVTWKEYKKSLHYTRLIAHLFKKGAKAEFINQVYSIPVNGNLSDVFKRNKVSGELFSFFFLLDQVRCGNLVKPSISARLYHYQKETLGVLANYIGATSKIGRGNLDTPVDLLILEWVGSQIPNVDVRRYQIVPRMIWVSNIEVTPKNKSTDLTVCINNLYKFLNLTNVLDAVSNCQNNWKYHEKLCEDYMKILEGQSPHKLIRYDSDEWNKLVSSSNILVANYTLNINEYLNN